MEKKQDGGEEALDAFIEQVREKYDIPGIALGITHRGETRCAGYGVTNVDHPLPVTPDTLFQIGSITKTFTGTIMMRLVEMGRLDLAAKVRDYLPEFRVADEEAAARVTIRHLLTHTGGFAGDVFVDTGPGADALERYVEKMADLEQLAPPGMIFSYNNAGFSLAGRIIEVVTGQSYEDVLQETILEPLGLRHTFIHHGEVMTYRFAVGHEAGDEGAQVERPWPLPRSINAAGGIICDVNDLLQYARFHLGEGETAEDGRLPTRRAVVAMQEPQVPVWDHEYRGLSWIVKDLQGVRQISHGGGTVGQISLLVLIPEKSFALAILTNSENGSWATYEICDWILKRYFELETSKPQAQEATAEDLAQFVGRYRRPYAEIELGILAGRLTAQEVKHGSFPTQDRPPQPPAPPVTLALCGPDRLLGLNGNLKGKTAEVIRREDGSIGWLRVYNRLHVRQE